MFNIAPRMCSVRFGSFDSRAALFGSNMKNVVAGCSDTSVCCIYIESVCRAPTVEWNSYILGCSRNVLAGMHVRFYVVWRHAHVLGQTVE